MLDNALTKKNAYAAILLSQHDQLQPYFESIGISPDDPLQALRVCLPTVYGVAERAGERLKLCYIASVAETEPFVDEQNNAWNRPKENFSSEGLSEVMVWLAMAAKGVRGNEQRTETIKKETETTNKQTILKQLKRTRTMSKLRMGVIAFIALGILFPIGMSIRGTTYKKIYKEHWISVPRTDYNPTSKNGGLFENDDITITNTSNYNFKAPVLRITFQGEQLSDKITPSDLVIHPGQSYTYEKVHNFSYTWEQVQVDLLRQESYADEEASQDGSTLFFAIPLFIIIFFILIFVISKLPHRNDALISDVLLHATPSNIPALKKWLSKNKREDQWWLSLDGVTRDTPMTLDEISSIIYNGSYKISQVLHISESDSQNPNWIEIGVSINSPISDS